MQQQVAIGVDLGGTNLKVALVDADGGILHKHSETTPLQEGSEGVIAAMARCCTKLMENSNLTLSNVVGVGIGSPGPLSPKTGRIIRSANLPGWENVPIRDRLAELTRLQVTQVTLDNDANAAAFGEFWAGAGNRTHDLVMITLGTGVGMGVILDQRVLHGHFENAAEGGHMIVVVDGDPCPCGQRGCLEQYASASAVARRVEQAIRGGESSELSVLLETNKKPDDRARFCNTDEPRALARAVLQKQDGRTMVYGHIEARHVAQAAQNGDPVCLRIWEEACQYLAVACINLQHLFNPAMVVFGGGMAGAGDFLLRGVKRYLQKHQWRLYEDMPEITIAKLGYDAGVIGAAGLAWQTS